MTDRRSYRRPRAAGAPSLLALKGNAVKDFGGRIRQNSGAWRESLKSGDFGYEVRAYFVRVKILHGVALRGKIWDDRNEKLGQWLQRIRGVW
jgi:hypothetical protein